MIYKHVRLDIPKDKCYKNTIKGKTYLLYEVGSEYVPGKKYNKKIRVVIGRVCEDDETKFHPNRNYFEQYPNADISLIAQVEQKQTVRGKDGMHVVIDEILEELHVNEVLDSMKLKDKDLIKDLISYSLIEHTNNLEELHTYINEYALYSKKEDVSKSCINTCLKQFDDGTIKDFMQLFGLKNQCENDIVCVWMLAKDKQGGYVIIGFSQNKKLPIYYERYTGVMNEEDKLQEVIDRLKTYGFNQVMYIEDQRMVEMITKYKGQFETHYDCKVEGENVFVIKDSMDHLFYSPSIYVSESNSFYKKLDEIKRELNQCNKTSSEYISYFDIEEDKNHRIMHVQPNGERINNVLYTLGYFGLRTSSDMNSEEVYEFYKLKQDYEKTCVLMLNQEVEEMNFIWFIASVVYQCLVQRLVDCESYDVESFIHEIKKCDTQDVSYIQKKLLNAVCRKKEVNKNKTTAN